MRTRNNIRRYFIVLSAAALAMTMIAGPAAGRGPDPDRLAQAGWFCFGHDAAAIHCMPDGEAVETGQAKSSLIMTWGTATGEFWGTELLIHEDLYNDQPCPQDLVNGERSTYIPLKDLGLPLPYVVCHHFDSPLT